MRETRIGTVKYALVVMLTLGGLVVQPALPAGARGASDPTTPPSGEQHAARLERIWWRQQRGLDRLGFMFDHSAQRLDHAQDLIDWAKGQGKDVGALQAGLDAFSDALHAARPLLDQAKEIQQSHKGFDGKGRVIDLDTVSGTVEEMAQALEAIRDNLRQPGRDLWDAIRDFRRTNRPAGA